MVLGWLLVARFVGLFLAQIDTDAAQSVCSTDTTEFSTLASYTFTKFESLSSEKLPSELLQLF